jgi:hypothetical protein
MQIAVAAQIGVTVQIFGVDIPTPANCWELLIGLSTPDPDEHTAPRLSISHYLIVKLELPTSSSFLVPELLPGGSIGGWRDVRVLDGRRVA